MPPPSVGGVVRTVAKVSKQRRCPCRGVAGVVAVAKVGKMLMTTMKFGRRNWMSFVDEIALRPSSLVWRSCEILGGFAP